MNWTQLLSTPAPEAVWSFDSEAVAVLRRDSRSGNRCVAAKAPPDLFTTGPAGLHSVQPELLQPLLERLLHSAGISKRPAIVLPTAWTRIFFIEGDDLPKKTAELEEIVRWRLKKLVPIPPEDLRLAISEQKKNRESRRILCSVAMARPLEVLEESFASAGMKPGLILPRILAGSLKLPEMPEMRLILQQESSFFSMALIEGEEILFLRTKPLSAKGESPETLQRELILAQAFIEDKLKIESEIDVLTVIMDPALKDALKDMLEDIEGLRDSGYSWPESCPDPLLSESLGPGRLECMTAILHGGAP